jgi:flavin reductase (DIM6/NTAB) family NADH-FMN oxidoreductase RutF
MTVAPYAGSIEAERFRQVMSALAAGVSVVTTLDSDGQPRGLTTTAVTSVSLEPPLVLVCVGWDSRTLPAIKASGRFAVNFISAAATGLAVAFASKAEDKFERARWRHGRHGSPILADDAVAWIECRVESEIEAGDHVVLIAHVEHGDLELEEPPLTYFQRRFGTWASHDHVEERSTR